MDAGQPGDGHVVRRRRDSDGMLGDVVVRHRRIVVFVSLVVFVVIQVVFGFAVANLRARQDKDDRRAERERTVKIAGAQSNYRTCVLFVPIAEKLNAKFHSADVFAATLIRNAQDMHNIADPTSPTYKQQAINLRRLRATFAAGRGGGIPVFTLQDCATAREKALRG